MGNRILIILMMISCSLTIYGQNESALNSEVNKFYCRNWLFEFPDTLYIYKDSIPTMTKYSEVKKSGNSYYNLLCWTGENVLETPTQSKEKLKIKFTDKTVTFKFGKLKAYYMYPETKGQIILTKRE